MCKVTEFLTVADRDFLEQRGVEAEEAVRQWGLLSSPPQPVCLDRPCTIGDGIRQIADNALDELIEVHRSSAKRGRWTKFVPASGAASRMFAFKTVQEQKRFCESIEKFAFADRLRKHLAVHGVDLDELRRAGRCRDLTEAVLGRDGLDYSDLPKGLIEFHRYQDDTRTPFEEHLLESHACFGDHQGNAVVHFTIAPEHQELFSIRLGRFRKRYDGVGVSVQFSTQRPSTDTIAMGDQGELVRSDDGNPMLRPGGHGALIDNLADLRGDLIFVKNIDNVGHEHLERISAPWMQALGGYLVLVREKINEHVQLLRVGDRRSIDAARDFVQETFAGSSLPDTASSALLRKSLVARLNRPLRVCGMVRNEGEPGGGPFWVRQSDGDISVQIVETAEVDLNDEGQGAVIQGASHFNPVFMALAVRDECDKPYALRQFVEQSRVIVTHKPVRGQAATVLERPGLWNGAMAQWNSIFVEVPKEVFSPVKTVFDLLRNEHQPMRSTI
jgi:hypothetical protein